MKDAIGYRRVSTQEQRRSGLGLSAQRLDIETFGVHEGFSVKVWRTVPCFPRNPAHDGCRRAQWQRNGVLAADGARHSADGLCPRRIAAAQRIVTARPRPRGGLGRSLEPGPARSDGEGPDAPLAPSC
jgi:hypothetical protein